MENPALGKNPLSPPHFLGDPNPLKRSLAESGKKKFPRHFRPPGEPNNPLNLPYFQPQRENVASRAGNSSKHPLQTGKISRVNCPGLAQRGGPAWPKTELCRRFLAPGPKLNIPMRAIKKKTGSPRPISPLRPPVFKAGAAGNSTRHSKRFVYGMFSRTGINPLGPPGTIFPHRKGIGGLILPWWLGNPRVR